MLNYYQPTPLEQWIEALWTKAGILAPSQLTIDEVADRLNVWIHYLNDNSKALEWMGMRSILIDRRLSPAEQWEDFLHELCHILRHAGNQTVMPRAFLEQQEAEAKRFVLYASMPYYMMKGQPLPARQSEAAEGLSQRFGVTYSLACQRLEQFQRRAFEAILWEELWRYKLDEGYEGEAIPRRSESEEDRRVRKRTRPGIAETRRLLTALRMK